MKDYLRISLPSRLQKKIVCHISLLRSLFPKAIPIKLPDQISDNLVDHFLAFDPSSKVACETLVTTGQVILAGEVKSKTYLDVQQLARDVIRRIGYTKSEYMFEANSLWCIVFDSRAKP